MPARRTRRALLTLAATALLTLAACDGAAPPVAPGSASPDAPRYARGSTQQTRPDGKGIGTSATKGNRTSQKVGYHGGAVLSTTTPFTEPRRCSSFE